MKFNTLVTAGSMLAGAVMAAPWSSAGKIVKRNTNGFNTIDFDYVIAEVRDINERYLAGRTLQRREDSDFIENLMLEFHNHNLLNDFLDELTSADHLTDAVHDGVTLVISSGAVNETVLLNALRSSGKLLTFFDLVLNDEDLNDELYGTAKSILTSAQANDATKTRRNIDSSAPMLEALYKSELKPKAKRDFYDDDTFKAVYGKEKRELLDTIVSLVKEILSSQLVKDIISSITGNQLLLEYGFNLLVKLFKEIPWLSVYNAIKSSGIISKVFLWLMSLLASLFNGTTLTNLIDELFGSGSTSTALKSFLATLLSVGVELGSDLFKSLTSGSGLLSELLDTLFGLSNLTSDLTSTSSGSGSSLGSIVSLLFDSLFGLGSGSSSSSGSTTAATSASTGGLSLLDDLFDDIFGSSTSSSSGGSSGGSSSGSSSSSSSSSGFSLGSLIDSLFGGLLLLLLTTTPATSSAAGSNTFTSSQACCCLLLKIKKRALKRALRRKVKRSVKRGLTFETPLMQEGVLRFFLIK